MQRMQRRVLSSLGSVAMAALLLVPLLLRGHHHWSHDPAARSCAACVVAQHTAAVHTPLVGPVTPAFRTFSLPRTAPRIVVRLSGSSALGRAPPRDPSRAV